MAKSNITQRHASFLVRYSILIVLFAASEPKTKAQQFWRTDGTSATWTSASWGTSNTGPFTSAWVSGSNSIFTENSTITFATTTIGNVTVDAGKTVTIAQAGTMSTGGAARTFDIGTGATLTWTNQNVSTSASQAGFIKNGGGTWNIGAQANAYNATNFGFTLNAGIVIVSGNNSFGGANSLLTINGGTIQSSGTRAYSNNIVIGGDFTNSGTGNATFSGTVALGAATRKITNSTDSGSRVYSGVVSGSIGAGLTFDGLGAGQTYIGNAGNTFTGTITILGSEVGFANDGSLGNATNTIVIDGGRLTSTSTSGSAVTSTWSSTRSIQVGDSVGTSISVQGGAGFLTYDGVIADITGKTGSWNKQGGGVLRLGGESTYSGNTAINNGTVQLSVGNNRLPVSTVLSLGQAASTNLGTLDLNGFNQEVAGLNSITGTNAIIANKNTVTSATAATLTLSGTGTYTYSQGTAAASGVLTGALALAKTGSGTQVFGEANTYSGSTTVSGGTLVINNSSGSGTGTGAVTIASSGTLAGTGRIAPAADTNINLNGSVYVGDTTLASPVASILELATSGTGSTISSSSAIFYFDLFYGAGSEGLNALTTADHIKLPGLLTNHSSGTLVIGNPLAMTDFKVGDAWNLFNLTGGGSIANDFNLDYSGLNLDPAVLAGQFDRSTGTFSIAHVIPEPSRALLFILGLATLCLHRRRVPVTDP